MTLSLTWKSVSSAEKYFLPTLVSTQRAETRMCLHASSHSCLNICQCCQFWKEGVVICFLFF